MLAKKALEAITTHETITMKIKPSQKLKKAILEVNPQTEPRVAAALFRTARRLPAVRCKKILTTTDFSKSSMEGVRYATSLADKLGASVALVHVVEPAPRFSGMDQVVLAQGEAEVAKQAERQLAGLAERQSKKGCVVRSFVRHGKSFHEIAALAGSREVDLIVIATRGHAGLKRILLGSTAERVVRHAPCPVLTVPSRSADARDSEAPAFRLKRIVVPIDFSQTSAQALPYAAALAERFGAEIILLHVVAPVPLPLPFYVRRRLQESAGSLAELAMDEPMSRLCEEAFDKEMPSRTLVRTGVPSDEITKAARSLGADLIILTTHGYTGLKHALLGSTAERVVRNATCPVLVVRESVGTGKKRTLSKRKR